MTCRKNAKTAYQYQAEQAEAAASKKQFGLLVACDWTQKLKYQQHSAGLKGVSSQWTVLFKSYKIFLVLR
jgi:hypothetical protein